MPSRAKFRFALMDSLVSGHMIKDIIAMFLLVEFDETLAFSKDGRLFV